MNQWDTETAEWYAKNYGEYATNRLGVENIDLATDSTIVDIGCGTGCALRHASNYVTDGVLIGIDPVPRMIEIARQQTGNHPASHRITFREGSAEHLPVEDSLADIVFAFDSFDHWKDQEQGLTEVRRILKARGQLVLVKDGGLPARSDYEKKIIDLLKDAGFELVTKKDITENSIECTRWVFSAN
ncbi:class I SAM-dependent methyltransferase [Marinobacter xestospongiae]|uniref:Class I SAM-dependent methyltransferase n=1 Tax=Marinobacter xestospongiae TaxID=994319 RepID=A0ABU3VVF6_9GAMM|nr:class I SAM-dependent methyltransferase [Marinobacter xestospongiae]MCK7566397.1 class I SAM-dependent methyltransferase [Marinobacter xestospongiae]MDV2078262.1 class I SAM-dependent methyltransferase [Marinobacter xestospongiae]